MNLGTAKKEIFMMIDSYSRNGNLLDQNAPKQKDYVYKIPGLCDAAQKQIATIKKILRKKPISHNMPTNILPMPLYQFDITQYIGVDQTYEATGAKAYYFEADDVATVYIEEKISGVWTTLITITNPLENAGQFTAYKGLIGASSSTNSIRIRFSGATGYNHRNRALFSFPFSDATRIPNYQRYVLYTMPDNFYQLNKVVLKGNVTNSQPYESTADFFWEGQNQCALNWFNQAEYSIEYFAYPSDITIATDDSHEFETSPETHAAIIRYVASKILMNEDNTFALGQKLYQEYESMLANLDTKITSGPTSISNTLFQSGSNKLF